MMQPTTTLPDRFWSKVIMTNLEQCWEWTAALDAGGYGAFYLHGGRRKAHRLTYQDLMGAIPDGLVLDHLCRVRSCVNPLHLEPVSHEENIARGVASRTKCRRGHEYSHTQPSGRRVCVTCRKRWETARQERLAAAQS